MCNTFNQETLDKLIKLNSHPTCLKFNVKKIIEAAQYIFRAGRIADIKCYALRLDCSNPLGLFYTKLV